MTPPVRYLDDFSEGEQFDLGSFTFTEAEIIAFATEFDPQEFHIDPVAAKEGPFGGIIASGWHTSAKVMRLMVDNFIPKESALGSPGIDELRWLRPVRPGIEYRVRYLIEAVVPSRSKDDRGHIEGLLEALDPAGDVVMSFRGRGIYRRRI